MQENLKLGSELSPKNQAYILRSFVHRFTGDHKPAWADTLRSCGGFYQQHFIDDKDFLANTDFFVTKSGELDKRYNYCNSRPTLLKKA